MSDRICRSFLTCSTCLSLMTSCLPRILSAAYPPLLLFLLCLHRYTLAKVPVPMVFSSSKSSTPLQDAAAAPAVVAVGPAFPSEILPPPPMAVVAEALPFMTDVSPHLTRCYSLPKHAAIQSVPQCQIRSVYCPVRSSLSLSSFVLFCARADKDCSQVVICRRGVVDLPSLLPPHPSFPP